VFLTNSFLDKSEVKKNLNRSIDIREGNAKGRFVNRLDSQLQRILIYPKKMKGDVI